MAQCQRFEADFPDDGNSGTADHYVVLMPGWQLTLRYRFPALNTMIAVVTLRSPR